MNDGPIVRRISFDIHGEFITQLAHGKRLQRGGERNMAGRMRTDETSMLKRRIRADKRLREELSRNNAETREMIHETYQEIAEQLEIEGDWDEVYVQDQFNDDYEVRDVIEAFYDCMIEKVLNYIGAE